MANDLFEPATDVHVEFYIAATKNFINNVSRFNSGDVWASSNTFSWQDLKCELVQVNVSRGASTNMGIMVDLPQTTATIVLQTASLDPFSTGTIHPGTQVRITYTPEPDSDPGSINYLFVGVISSCVSSYDAVGNTLVTIECVTNLEGLFNTRIASYTVASSTKPYSLLSSLFSSYGFTLNHYGMFDDTWNMAAQTYTNTTVGEITKRALTVAQGAISADGNGGLTYYSSGDMNAQIQQEALWLFESTHSSDYYHVCMTDLQIIADSKQLPSVIAATLTTGTVITKTNADLQALFGTILYQTDLDINNTTDGNKWLAALTISSRLRRVNSLTFPAIARTGKISNYHFAPSADWLFGVTAKVQYEINNSSVIDYYFISKQTDTITRTSWDTTLELWRGI